ncbi:hypothetical protein TKK_0008232 [Trichogramma kaykai]|uniref:PUM-HD domain-containing protein n=1 Tax=Trichogramma kaykai TaxID=54128 RepID=A0ABD2X5P0_9HYME
MEGQHVDTPRPNLKRKKKRSSMQMAKKAARRRFHDGELDSESYQYMLNVLQMIRSDFPTMEDKETFVENVFEQTRGKEMDYAKNQVGSRVLDVLIQHANFDTIIRLADSFYDSLRPLCSDPFASHVIQKLITTCAHKGNYVKTDEKDTTEIKHSEVEKYNEIALKLCRYAINNIEEFVWDTYANHILRTAIECLGGIIDLSSANNMVKKKPDLEKRRTVNEDYKKLLMLACNNLLRFPQLAQFNHDQLTAGFMQSVLYTLKDVDSDLNSNLMNRVFNECFTLSNEETLSNIFDKECSFRVLEAILAVSNPKDHEKIYKNYFENHLGVLSIKQGANFSVQRLIEYCTSKEIFEKIFDEIVEHFNSILSKSYTGVFAALAKGCWKLQAKQGPFINALMKLLDCDQPKERENLIVPLLMRFSKFEKYSSLSEDAKSKLPMNLHGSLCIQSMLEFNKPIKIVNSLLAMDSTELCRILEHPKGSRIMDSFMDSQFIGGKSREQLAKHLRGTWAQLARSTHGSRCLEKVWASAKPPQKLIIMTELAEVGELLRSTPVGKIISHKLNVPLFARNKKEWEEFAGKEEKTKTLFADIIQRIKD